MIAIGIAMILHAMHGSGAAAEPDIEDPEVVLVDPLHVGQTSSSQPVSFLLSTASRELRRPCSADDKGLLHE